MKNTILSTLKIIAKPAIKNINPIYNRRNKLLVRLQEQRALALSFIDGKPLIGADKEKVIVDKVTGHRTTLIVQKRVKTWFSGSNDAMIFEVRYGNVALELAIDKTAIAVGSAVNLVPTIDAVIGAVKAGELDELLKNFSTRKKS